MPRRGVGVSVGVGLTRGPTHSQVAFRRLCYIHWGCVGWGHAVIILGDSDRLDRRASSQQALSRGAEGGATLHPLRW